MSEFKPYEKEQTYKAVLTKDEVLIIQKLRLIGFGSMTIHLVANKPIRTEITSSELIRDAKDEIVTAFEVVM